MRLLKWVSIMWVVCYVPARLFNAAMMQLKPEHADKLVVLLNQVVSAAAVLGLLAVAPAIALAWVGYAVWQWTGPKKDRVKIEFIPPAPPPPSRPAPRDAGHRWLS